MRFHDQGGSHRRRQLVAVSGGRDSVALLDLLYARGQRKLVVCHLNHALRGRESGADAAFVRRLAAGYGLECVVERRDVAKLAREHRESLEAAGRRARLDFYARVAGEYRCREVYLGHHADDQVETVLINLFRGCGTLTGMRHASEHQVGRRTLTLLRPMLDIWRDEIDAYVSERGLKFRDDASNASDSFLRNRVRNELVPLLRDLFQRDVTKAVSRAAFVAAAEDALLDRMRDDFPFAEEISVEALRQCDLALQRRVALRWLRDRGVPDVGFTEVERLLEMLHDNSVAKVNLPGDHHARRRAGLLFVE